MKWFSADILNCTRCPLHKSRTQVVLGRGNRNPLFIYVGEAPGRDEDREGCPFVGRCGKLLDRMLLKFLGITRDMIFITNSNLCRPERNRKPVYPEMLACRPRLEYTLSYFDCLIVAAGAHAVEAVTGFKGIGGLRGDVLPWKDSRGRKRIVVPVYHTAYILRTRDSKEAENDFQNIKRNLK